MGLAIDGDRPLLHGLEQRRLRLGRGTVDFIGQQKRCKDGTFDQYKCVPFEIEDMGSGNVCGHQVRSELNSSEIAPQHVGQGPDEKRLGHSRNALNQGMMAGKNCD